LDRKDFELVGSAKKHICEDGEQLELRELVKTKRRHGLIFVKVSEDPFMFMGIPVRENGHTSEVVLRYVCEKQKLNEAEYKLMVFADESFPITNRIFKNAQLSLVKK
jgi:hypothetical protein